MTAEVTRANALFPSHVAINCWRQDEHESAAMWKLYASEHEGIAVTSTIERLCASFADCGEQVHVGRVSYVDYASVLIDEGNMFTPFLHKRCSFDYEREIRAVVAFGISTTEEINRVPDQLGIYIPIDLSILLSAIVVSPAAPNWFLDVVSSAVGRTTYKPAVLRSAMSGNAVY